MEGFCSRVLTQQQPKKILRSIIKGCSENLQGESSNSDRAFICTEFARKESKDFELHVVKL